MTFNEPLGQPGFPPAAGVPGMPGQLPATGPTGQLVVNIQGSPLSTGPSTPRLMVDGQQMPSTYGLNTLTVPAGPHSVQLHAQMMRKYGHAAMDVHVPPSGTTHVHYAAPFSPFDSEGSIGHDEQRSAGVSILWIVLGLLGVFIFVPLILSLVLN